MVIFHIRYEPFHSPFVKRNDKYWIFPHGVKRNVILLKLLNSGTIEPRSFQHLFGRQMTNCIVVSACISASAVGNRFPSERIVYCDKDWILHNLFNVTFCPSDSNAFHCSSSICTVHVDFLLVRLARRNMFADKAIVHFAAPIPSAAIPSAPLLLEKYGACELISGSFHWDAAGHGRGSASLCRGLRGLGGCCCRIFCLMVAFAFLHLPS